MMTDKDLTDDVLDEIIAGAKTSMEQYLALSLKAERAANRQQNSQQNITENILVTQFKPVADLYGLTSPTGSETSFTFDAVEARDFIDGGWSCQEYVELGRFQEAVSGNSPVIPDGWVMVPEEPTHEILEAGDEQFGTYDVYRRMIAASPQQK
ncbi:hypothetical protein M8R55_04750 [Enterobacter hormaechei]|uniref:hypothetical protein n=1 Tax=Enterobacter TaxID=547 RepID=UPI000699AF9E|nr:MULTISPECIES: hypothetical protein [Enterobacter]PJI17884.1 hypothetical protein CVE39_00060 [Enterobacter cloacae complex sp.]MBU0249701.1 hypothetical protein [Enterobacter hormaechei]MCG0492524.1 hypothetical protein [Enterobacter hormaechei]MCG0533465.1 hypothetical protein [Enterobacter hormaechei]MCG0548022.1 hypothetical protein [Enterobacter hormaechei]